MIKKMIVVAILLLTSVNAYAADYYISPTGDDVNDGLTQGSPIATFVQAHSLMSSGDTLILMDGTYDEQLYIPHEDSGTAGNYTTFKALNRGKAIIAPTTLRVENANAGSLWVYSTSSVTTSYIEFDGLFVEGVRPWRAISISSSDAVDNNTMTHHINVKNCGAFGNNYVGANSVEISFSRDVLFEDCFAFGMGRKPFEIYVVQNIVLRRLVLRFDWWEHEPGPTKANDPRDGLAIYNAHDTIIENLLVFDMGSRPVAHLAGDAAAVTIGGNNTGQFIDGSVNIDLYGCILFNNKDLSGTTVHNGFMLNGGSGSEGTAESPGSTSNVHIHDSVSTGNSGYGLNVFNNIVLVDIDTTTTNNNGTSGINVAHSPQLNVEAITVDRAYSDNNGNRGFYTLPGEDQTNSTGTNNINQSDIEPSYAPVVTYLPTSTPVSGHERGATVEFKYINGVESAENLWPYPNETIIKDYMCDSALLQTLTDRINIYNTDNPGDGWTNRDYLPDWCATNKTLTDYVWSYLGTPCPDNICSVTGPLRSAGAPTTEQPSGTTSVVLTATTDVPSTCTYGADGVTGIAYPLANTMDDSSNVHTVTISGLSDGNSYSRSIRCAKDSDSEANDTDFTLMWSIAASGGGGSQVQIGVGNSQMINIGVGNSQIIPIQ